MYSVYGSLATLLLTAYICFLNSLTQVEYHIQVGDMEIFEHILSHICLLAGPPEHW